MKNVLISIMGDVNDDMYLETIYQDFEPKGFNIEQFNLNTNQMDIDSLPIIIDYLRNEERYWGVSIFLCK